MMILAQAAEAEGASAPVWLAVAGFVLALVSLTWQFYNAWRSDPRLRVLRRTHYRMGSEAQSTFGVVVINTGAVGTTVDDVGISLPSGDSRSVQQVRDNGGHVNGPDLPARLDGHDAKTWHMAAEFMWPGQGDLEAYGWAQQYVHRRWWSRDPLRRIGIRTVKCPTAKSTF